MTDNQQAKLEDELRRLTTPINGQYPRPWMTTSKTPWSADVFIVGRNQKNGFPVDVVGSHESYLDTLFNRNGRSCRGLYDEIVAKTSPTRSNTDRLTAKLRAGGVTNVIETNVICYSTPMSSDLRSVENKGGTERGTEIFRTIFDFIKPRVLVVHGAGSAKDLGRLLGTVLPAEPTLPEVTARATVNGTAIWVIPSLAPPRWNSWIRWADQHLDLVCRQVTRHLGR